MQLFLFLVFGLAVGVLARMIVPGRQSGGWITSMVIGIVGSFVGAYLGKLVGLHGEGRMAGVLMSLVGAIVLLLVYHAVTWRMASS